MIDPEDDDDRQDRSLAGYEQKLSEKQDELLELQLNIALSVDISELQAFHGWARLVDRLRSVEDSYLKRLRYEKLDKYTLGKLQGSLGTMANFIRTKPTSPETLAKAVKRCSDLEAQIADLRKVVAQ